MAEARIYPPSEQRIAEARRAGHVPRPSLVGVAVGSAALSAAVDAWADGLCGHLATLFRRGLLAGVRDTANAAAFMAEEVRPILAASILWLLVLGVCMVLALWLAQGQARVLPFQSLRRRFPRLDSPRASVALWCVLFMVAWLAALHEGMRVEVSTLSASMTRWLWRLSALTVVATVLDVVLARVSFLRSLWLTRQEYRDDQREAHGAPEIRSMRARLRRASVEAPKPESR